MPPAFQGALQLQVQGLGRGAGAESCLPRIPCPLAEATPHFRPAHMGHPARGGHGWRLVGSSYPPRSCMSFSRFRWSLIL